MSTFNVGNLKLQERRDSKRLLQNRLMPGKIIRKLDGKALSCRPVDVSENGLGILLAEQLAEDEILTLVLRDETKIELRVVWSKRDFGKQDFMRYGLECNNTKINLINIFIRSEK